MGDNARASALMVAAMAAFAVEDMCIKAAARHLPVGQVALMFGLAGLAVFAGLAWRQGQAVLPRAFLSPVMVLRSGCEVAGRLFYALAVALTPLSSASAILQATPLVVVAGAALFLGERVGWRRWAAIGAGFAGVLIILRPGLAGFSPLSLLAVAGMLGFAGRDLATRAAPPGLSNQQLGVAGFAMLALSGAVLLALWGGAVWPDVRDLLWVGGATVTGVAAYTALTGAMRTGDVAVVTPFRYTRLVFALILGVAVFGERPDAPMLLGSAVIVAAGLYTLLRARRVALKV